ncbi:MAG: glycosyltransferase [Deltaproteobacteria bacterium]|nr:MAG: glycosyltransferase [Deltaproteobacteria bacterium]
MRVLQVTSDWKWTGPADPMLRLALALRERGDAVALACPAPPPGASRSLDREARARGMAPSVHLERARGLRPLRDRADIAQLRRLAAEHRAELVHTWHTRDHLLALRAFGWLRRDAVRVVRSLRRAETLAATPWNRGLLGPGTDGLLCVSPGVARRNARLRGGRPIVGAFGAVDLDRFAPRARDPRVREALGLKPEHRVVGIVARAQRHRRFDLLLEAACWLFEADPAARLLIVGRGTRRAEVAERPAERLGIADRVVFAGYRGEDYAEVLRAIDVFTFLVPGSDGTCRALLEAAACGLPAVTTRRGALPEIVVDGETGILVDETPAALAAAWRRLLEDPARRAAFGAAAGRRARALFAPERLADAATALYRAALASDARR